MADANKKYKDRLFYYIFGKEENKAWTLSLYNAVNGSDHTDSGKSWKPANRCWSTPG